MSLPVNIDTVNVSGTFINSDDGSPCAGTVEFIPTPCWWASSSASTTIIAQPRTIALDNSGSFELELIATDDEDLNPVDWTYRVRVRLTDCDTAYSFDMAAPLANPVIHLADVTPIYGSAGNAIIVGPPGPDGADGLPGQGVPPGGNAGDVLAKFSGTDFDSGWQPASAPGLHSATHAVGGTDPVTLAESQVTGLPATLAGKADAAATTTALAAKVDKTTTIATIAPLTGGGDLSVNRTLDVSNFGTAARGVVPASGGGTTNFLRADGTWAAPPAGGGGGITAEDAVDAVAAALVEGTGIDLAYNDVANTITITADKTEMGLTKADVGLGNVDNTSDANKPVSTATQTALNAKADLTSLAGYQPLDSDLTTIGALAPANDTVVQRKAGAWVASTPATVKTDLALTKSDVGLANVDNTSDAAKPVSTAQATAIAAKADKTTLIATTAPLTGGGDLSANRTLDISTFTATVKGAVPPPTTPTGKFLMDDGTWAAPSSSLSGVSGVFPFTYNTSTLESITGNQMRGNNATFASSTKLWISETTVDGLDVAVGLGRIKAGFQVYVQDYTSSSRYAIFNVTADSVDKGTYWEVTVTPMSSAGTIPGGKIALQSLSAAQASNLFSTTTTAPGLTPGSNAAGATSFLNGAGAWTVPAGTGVPTSRTLTTTAPLQIGGTTSADLSANRTLSILTGTSSVVGALQLATAAEVLTGTDTAKAVTSAGVAGAYTPKSIAINAQTGTTYTLVLADAGKLLTHSNAAAITVTVPPNSSVAFPVGTQITLLQTGAGKVTVAQGGGVTVNGTPSLGFRAQYSGATLIKTGTDQWYLVGDLA